MKLMDFYKNILTDVDISVDENGYLKAKVSDDEEVFVTRKKGKRVLLPTKEVLDNFYDDVDGSLEPKGLIFNPIKEVISVDCVGLDVFRDAMSIKISNMIAALGNNIILCLMNPDSQGDLGLEINQCFAEMRKNVTGMKNNAHIGDETMIKNWGKLMMAVTSDPEISFVSILTSSDKNKKYSKIGKVLISVYEELNSKEENEKVKIGKLTLRPKDRIVFSSIIKLLMPDIDEKGVMVENTEIKDTPTFITLLNMFYKISNKYKDLIDAVKHLDTECANQCVITNEYSREFINNINNKFANEKEKLPTENELNGTQRVLSIKTNKLNDSKELDIKNESKPVLQNYTEQKSNINPVKAALRNTHPELFMQPQFMPNPNVANTMVMQPMMQPMGQPVMQTGFNPFNKMSTNSFNSYNQMAMMNNVQQQPVVKIMNGKRPEVEKPDTLELKSNGHMVSLLDPSKNSIQANMYLAQQSFQQPTMFQQPMAQPMMVQQPMMQPMTFQPSPQPVFQQPMFQQPMMQQNFYQPMPGFVK